MSLSLPPQRRRRSIRLQQYDYSWPGAYFVTIVTHSRLCFLGEVADDQTVLSPFSVIVDSCWKELPAHYPHVELDAFVIMPNHIHGIIRLTDAGMAVGAGLARRPPVWVKPAPTTSANRRHSLAEVVRALKTFSARRINSLRRTPGAPAWQRNYYEHVVRDEDELYRIQEYITNNPIRWNDDPENPSATPASTPRQGSGLL